MASPEQLPLEEEGGLSPDTKAFFESGGKIEPKAEPEKKEEKAAAPEQKKAAPPPGQQPPEKKAAEKAAPAPAPAPEQKKVESPKDTPEVERENLKKALDEERSRRKEMAEQFKGESKKREELEGKFNRFLSLIQKEAEPRVPEFDADPAMHLKQRQDQIAARQNALERQQAEREQQFRQEGHMRQFQAHVAGQMQAFTKEAPDYGDAYGYVRGLRAKELDALGVPEEHKEGLLNQWEMQLAAAALQLGKNPAAALYAQAQALGYTKKEAAAIAEAQAPEQKLEQLARGAEAAKGLGGGSGPQEMSLERIMQMDEDEMADMVRGKNWNKVAKFFKK